MRTSDTRCLLGEIDQRKKVLVERMHSAGADQPDQVQS
jgi:hypothetical protein